MELKEDLPNRGGDERVIALGHVRHRASHEVGSAARWRDDAGDGRLDAFMGIEDDEPPSAFAVIEEGRSNRLGLTGTAVQADDLALAFGGDRDGYYRRYADVPADFGHFDLGGAESQITMNGESYRLK